MNEPIERNEEPQAGELVSFGRIVDETKASPDGFYTEQGSLKTNLLL